MNTDSVPAVQYPARELQQEQHANSNNQAPPPLPPRHHQSGEGATDPSGDSGHQHHQHGSHEAGHHHIGPHEHGLHGALSSFGSRGGSEGSDKTHDALRNAYHILHGATEMVRGAILELSDSAGNALASKTQSEHVQPVDTERDAAVIERGKAELQKALTALKELSGK